MDVYLIRHTSLNIKPGICYGRSNIPLSDGFPDEVKVLRSKLSDGLQHYTVYSSPSERCLRLARELVTVGVDITTDDRLLELDFGDWELQEWGTIDADRLKKWMENYVEEACPNGESYENLYDRVIDFWEELKNRNDKKVLIVTHAGVIRCLLSHLLNIPLSSGFRLEIGLGSISAVSVNDERIMIKYINK